MRKILAIAILLLSCGTDPSSSLSSRDKPLLVMLSGNATCGTDPLTDETSPRGTKAWPLFSTILAEHKDSPWLASCHDFSSNTVFLTSDNLKARRAGYDVILKDMDRLAASATRIAIWGHSYGGWQAIKATVNTASTLPISMLTDDPINRLNCTYSDFFGCTHGVSDMGKDLTTAKARATVWVNFYETVGFVHSQPIAEAQRNIQLPIRHIYMSTDKSVWNTFGQLAGNL